MGAYAAPMPRYLDTGAARRFYDRFGARQDSQAFYEDRALDLIVTHGDFRSAHRVFEFGCGTGRFAERLLTDPNGLPPDARYSACDLSETMVSLARQRLARFGDRVTIWQSDGGFDFSRGGPPFDRIVVTYVLDLLGPAGVSAFLAAAAEALEPGGLLASASLTWGNTLPSRAVTGVWAGIHRLSPSLVGGCYPLQLVPHLDLSQWAIRHHQVVRQFAVPSEVVIAERLDDPR